jgi:hypothetical protein
MNWSLPEAVAIRNSITDFRPGNCYRTRDLMAAPNCRSNHGTPTTWRRIRNDVPAIFDWPKHGPRRVKQAVGKLVDENGLATRLNRFF